MDLNVKSCYSFSALTTARTLHREGLDTQPHCYPNPAAPAC